MKAMRCVPCLIGLVAEPPAAVAPPATTKALAADGAARERP
ncbi:MAG: hypothetical protein NTW36_01025 [Planctomycetia bacterium]|nr:hypothetical protein [Planctomycetia bacterium]